MRILVRRYAILFLRDRRNATILAAQVLILGLGAAFLFHSDVFSYNELGEADHAAFVIVDLTWPWRLRVCRRRCRPWGV